MAHTGQVFLVGGPVRDQLLGLKAHDNDWVVVGTTPEQMLSAGFTQVGKDFPVFLHPETKEEYALARTERKQGHGYQGFVCHTSPDVTLEQDLQRRDFTINAMALSDQGELVDPYGGQQDLEDKVFRHVSPAFAEDPLRVLRGARFLSRFYHLGFVVAEETLALMAQLAKEGELAHLSAERVWKETERALTEPDAEQYFLLLQQVEALITWWPELSKSDFELPDHLASKSDDGKKGGDQKRCAQKKTDPGVADQDIALLRWGYLLRDLPVAEIKMLCQRLRCPKRHLDFALLVQGYFGILQQPQAAESCLQLLEKSGVLKQGGLFNELLQLLPESEKHLKEQWQRLAEQVSEVKAQDYIEQGFKGPELGKAMKEGRLQKVQQWLGRLQSES